MALMVLLRNRPRDSRRSDAPVAPVTIRLATAADEPALERLAQRDSRPIPPAPLLVAERDRGIEAALSPATEAVIADPFRPTAELVELLRCRARGARLGPGATGPFPALGREPGPRPRLGLAGAGGCA